MFGVWRPSVNFQILKENMKNLVKPAVGATWVLGQASAELPKTLVHILMEEEKDEAVLVCRRLSHHGVSQLSERELENINRQINLSLNGERNKYVTKY